MSGHRSSDRSFYCKPGYNWCESCGSLATTIQKLPYEDSSTEIESPVSGCEFKGDELTSPVSEAIIFLQEQQQKELEL